MRFELIKDEPASMLHAHPVGHAGNLLIDSSDVDLWLVLVVHFSRVKEIM